MKKEVQKKKKKTKIKYMKELNIVKEKIKIFAQKYKHIIINERIGGRDMFVLDITNPLTLLLVVLATALLVFLGQEVKKSTIVMLPLGAFLIMLIIHVVQVSTLSEEFLYLAGVLYRCIALDFIFIFVTFFSYLWVDDIEAKKNNIKSIDNSLDWFWKEI